jgi:hypothetical protein
MAEPRTPASTLHASTSSDMARMKQTSKSHAIDLKSSKTTNDNVIDVL